MQPSGIFFKKKQTGKENPWSGGEGFHFQCGISMRETVNRGARSRHTACRDLQNISGVAPSIDIVFRKNLMTGNSFRGDRECCRDTCPTSLAYKATHGLTRSWNSTSVLLHNPFTIWPTDHVYKSKSFRAIHRDHMLVEILSLRVMVGNWIHYSNPM